MIPEARSEQSALSIADELFTVRDWLRYAVSRFQEGGIFFGHGTDNPWDEAVHLVLRSLQLPLENNAVFLDARLTRSERCLLENRIEERVIRRVPTAYLLKEAWFMGMPFVVDERVLVPRSPIAELLEAELEPWLGQKPVTRVLDLCTGSGCIGIGAAYVFPEAEVDLADISSDALTVAEQNIERHGLKDRVRVRLSDLFSDLEGRYDVILSNPPYVDAANLADMPAEFRHEPVLGLQAGDDGLDLAHRIIAQARAWLTDRGLLVVEVGNSSAALEAAYPELPLTWVEFEHGGEGVFVISAEDLPEMT